MELNTSVYKSPPPLPQFTRYIRLSAEWKKETLSLVDRDWGQDFNHMRK